MTPREEKVRKRAEELWEQAGKPTDRDEEFWYQAELEIGTGDERPPRPGKP